MGVTDFLERLGHAEEGFVLEKLLDFVHTNFDTGQVSRNPRGDGRKTKFRQDRRSIQLRASQVGAVQVGAIQLRVAQVGVAQVAGVQTGVAEPGLTQVGPAKVGPWLFPRRSRTSTA